MRSIALICSEKASSAQNGSDRIKLKKLARDAETLCLDENGHRFPCRSAGPFLLSDVVFPQNGDSVYITKGSKIFSTHPDFDQCGKKSKKGRSVSVRDVRMGYICDDIVRNMSVEWVGTGSYFMWTSLENIQA